MNKRVMYAVPLAALLLTIVACAKPPEADIAASRKALADSRGLASEYAQDSFKVAEDAEARLEAELKAQEGKFAMFRSYDEAKKLAAEASAASNKALADATAARDLARTEATEKMASAKTVIDELKTLLDQAPTGKGTQVDLALMKSDYTGFETYVTQMEASFNAGNYKDASAKAESVMQGAEKMKAELMAAIEAHSHKGRRTT